MIHRLFARATLAALAVMALQGLRRRQLRRQHERTRPQPEELQTWEGEGGSPPSVAGLDAAAPEPRSMPH
jgi:DNA-binding protein H-NS